jgi:hypothetical protein
VGGWDVLPSPPWHDVRYGATCRCNALRSVYRIDAASLVEAMTCSSIRYVAAFDARSVVVTSVALATDASHLASIEDRSSSTSPSSSSELPAVVPLLAGSPPAFPFVPCLLPLLGDAPIIMDWRIPPVLVRNEPLVDPFEVACPPSKP